VFFSDRSCIWRCIFLELGRQSGIFSVYSDCLCSVADDGSSTANVLEKGKQKPIIRFETESGLSVFVVSYNK